MTKFAQFIFFIILCTGLIIFGVGCEKNYTEKKDERVIEAIEIVKNRWNEVYEDRNIQDKYIEITNTKLINIKQNEDSIFSGMDYIVEFSLQTNFYETAPYYSDIGPRDSFVAVYNDGRKEIMETNPFQRYIRINGPTDFSDIIESIENYHGEYDQVIK